MTTITPRHGRCRGQGGRRRQPGAARHLGGAAGRPGTVRATWAFVVVISFLAWRWSRWDNVMLGVAVPALSPAPRVVAVHPGSTWSASFAFVLNLSPHR